METGLYEWVVGGLPLLEGIQGWRTPLLDFYFLAMTFLGEEEFFLISLPTIYWCFDKRLGRRLVYLLVVSNVVNSAFKNIFQMPRPPEELRMVQETSYGLPSGHAMNAVTLWGFAAWRLRWIGGWIWIIAIWVILSTAFSRLYLGIHYPADTVTGLILGVFTLLGFIWLDRWVTGWLPRADRRFFIPGAAILSLILLVVAPGDAYTYPAETTITLSGLFFGATVGFLHEMDGVRFINRGSPVQLLLRFLLGMVIALGFWMGLRVLFGIFDAPFWLEAILRFVRYALTGYAIAVWAPMLFVRLGLADREPSTSVGSPMLHTIGGVK
jgi:membrane-associated phospholipid phosphatase